MDDAEESERARRRYRIEARGAALTALPSRRCPLLSGEAAARWSAWPTDAGLPSRREAAH
jgi:hypothetical protein